MSVFLNNTEKIYFNMNTSYLFQTNHLAINDNIRIFYKLKQTIFSIVKTRVLFVHAELLLPVRLHNESWKVRNTLADLSSVLFSFYDFRSSLILIIYL